MGVIEKRSKCGAILSESLVFVGGSDYIDLALNGSLQKRGAQHIVCRDSLDTEWLSLGIFR